jgi:Zn-dependent protease
MACYFAARDKDSQLLLALAYSGCMLNLFNLIPLSPLDGGRITAIISPKVWLVGVPLLAALFLYRPSPMLILVGILAFPHLKAAMSGTSGPTEQYYVVPLDTRINYGVMYLGLVGFLAVMSFSIHDMIGVR